MSLITTMRQPGVWTRLWEDDFTGAQAADQNGRAPVIYNARGQTWTKVGGAMSNTVTPGVLKEAVTATNRGCSLFMNETGFRDQKVRVKGTYDNTGSVRYGIAAVVRASNVASGTSYIPSSASIYALLELGIGPAANFGLYRGAGSAVAVTVPAVSNGSTYYVEVECIYRLAIARLYDSTLGLLYTLQSGSLTDAQLHLSLSASTSRWMGGAIMVNGSFAAGAALQINDIQGWGRSV